MWGHSLWLYVAFEVGPDVCDPKAERMVQAEAGDVHRVLQAEVDEMCSEVSWDEQGGQLERLTVTFKEGDVAGWM
jgi:hypothetical protein